MEFLIVFAVLWLLWLISPKSRRRWLGLAAAVIAAILIVTSSAFVALLLWGLTVRLPVDPGTRVDAIVVLGRGEAFRLERMAATLDLWQTQRAPRIFTSGMMDAEAMIQEFQASKVPITALAGEECSETTEENAVFSSAILYPEGVRSILLVTDSSHLWRSVLVFQSLGFQVIPHSTTLNLKTQNRLQQLKILLREYAALIQYAWTGKFQLRPPETLTTPPPEVRQRIAEWNCKVPRQPS
jgi:uncharacterized SAM-binding protein YcdF (DUF218 family)